MKLLRLTLLLSLLSLILPQALRGQSSESRYAMLREKADSLHSIGKSDSAAILTSEALTIAEKARNLTGILGAHASIGVYLRSQGKIEEALEHYGKGVEIVTSPQFRENTDEEATEEAASLYINMAVLHLDMADKEDAARLANMAGEWAARCDDAAFRSMVYGVVGSVLAGCGEAGKALTFQEKSYADAIASGNDDAAFRAAAYALLSSDRTGDDSAASRWRGICVAMLPSVQAMTSKVAYYQVECSIALKRGDNRAAIDYFDKILSLDGVEGFPFLQLDCYNNMHLSYADLGDFKEAYGALLHANEIRDSLYEADKVESLRDLTVKYETKEKELALARSEASRMSALFWLVTAVGLLLTGVVFFLAYASRQRKRRHQSELEFERLKSDTERRLTVKYVEGLESERARMARELHDGVCNDLMAIRLKLDAPSSMADTRSLTDIAATVDTCRDQVRRISHELLPPEFYYATIDEVVGHYLRKLRDGSPQVEFIYDAEAAGRSWGEIPDDCCLGVYRILQEAVSNSLRHSGASRISVTLLLAGDTLSLTVADNGSAKDGGRHGGVGKSSMRQRAASAGGSLEVTHSESGTNVVFIREFKEQTSKTTDSRN